MIQLDQVSKSYDYGHTYAVQGADLRVEEGKLLVLVGESGSGKTTTLKMINRLIEPTSGSISVDGKNITSVDSVSLRRSIGYVFQQIGLFPHMTVAKNVATVPQLLQWPGDKTNARVDEVLEMVGLPPDEYRSRKPAELSGGQQQRVGFARALCARPKVMLLDEPFGALDPITRDGLRTELRKLQRELSLTCVMVTHDMTEALLLSDLIAVMYRGKILQVGTSHELMTSPAHEYVRKLIETPKRQADQLQALAESGLTTETSGHIE